MFHFLHLLLPIISKNKIAYSHLYFNSYLMFLRTDVKIALRFLCSLDNFLTKVTHKLIEQEISLPDQFMRKAQHLFFIVIKCDHFFQVNIFVLCFMLTLFKKSICFFRILALQSTITGFSVQKFFITASWLFTI